MPQMKAVANPNAATVNGSSRQSIHMDCSRMNGLLSASEQHAPFAAVVGHIPGTGSPSVPRSARPISAQVAVVRP
jgi:hypothetical protein